MYAVDNLSDAIDVTREFLTPIRLGMWLRLAIVVLFIGGAGFGGGVPGADFTAFSDDPVTGPDLNDDVAVDDDIAFDEVPWEELVIAAIVILVVLFVLYLIWSIISAIMEFVFVESLRSGEVHIRRYGNRNIGRAFSLFLFRIALSLLGLVLIGGPALALVFSGLPDEAMVISVLGLIAFALVFGLLLAIINRFTTVFVVPVMLHQKRGVLSAWSRWWATFKASWKEYAVYLILVWIVELAISIAVGIITLFAGLIVVIPFGLLIVVFVVIGETAGIVLAVLVGLVALLVLLLVALLIRVPVDSYLRYYALLILGDTDADLDLIPEQRAAVREGGEPGDDEDRKRWDDEDRRDDDVSWEDDDSRDDRSETDDRSDDPDTWNDDSDTRSDDDDRPDDDDWMDDDDWDEGSFWDDDDDEPRSWDDDR